MKWALLALLISTNLIAADAYNPNWPFSCVASPVPSPKPSPKPSPTSTVKPSPSPSPSPSPRPSPSPSPIPSTQPSPFPTVAVTPQANFMAMNLAGQQYWSIGIFNDVSHTFSGWFPTQNGPAVIFNSYGYPMNKGSCLSYLLDYPAGDYLATWDGVATIDFQWAKKVVLISPNSAVVTYGESNQAYLNVSGQDASNPFRNFHLYLPGKGPTSPVYTDTYTANLKRFAGLRTMGAAGTPQTNEVRWVDRVAPTTMSWADRGLPWEAEIAIAKESGVKRLWVNVPIGANDDYVSSMATLLRDNLPVGTEIMVEYSNEIWNWGGGFNGWAWANLEGNTTNPALYDGNIVNGVLIPDAPGVFVTDTYVRATRAAADRAYKISLIFKRVFTDRPNDFSMIWAGQAGWNAWATNGLQWVKAKYGVMPFKYLAIAPYFDPRWLSDKYAPVGGFKTKDDLLAGALKMVQTDIPLQIDAHKPLADQYGVTLIDYEGGQNFYALSDPYTATDPSTLAVQDPKIGQIYDIYLNILKQHGIVTHFELNYEGELWGKFGYWAVLQSPTDTGPSNYRWAALMREIPPQSSGVIQSILKFIGIR